MRTIKTKGRHQLRIIGGQWRGRKLAIADIEGLRPTGDRIRETLFNWLMGDIPESRCLDLFAGSGALGLECLSRGAEEVILLEKNTIAAEQLRQHCKLLNTTKGKIINADTLNWLKQPSLKPQSIDIVFIDPPFAGDLWQAAISALENSDLLANNALIYVETSKNTLLTTPEDWKLTKEKTTGQVCYRLFSLHRA